MVYNDSVLKIFPVFFGEQEMEHLSEQSAGTIRQTHCL